MSVQAELQLSVALLVTSLVVLGVNLWLRRRPNHGAQNGEELEREQLRSLINSLTDAVIATNSQGTILFYNGATLDLFNTNVSIEKQPLGKFITFYDEAGKPVNLFRESLEKKRSIKREDLHFITNEHQRVDLYVNFSPIHSGFGPQQSQGAIILLRDITKQKNLEEERDEFISVTSHELRTPIAITEANISTALHPSISSNMNPAVKQLLEQAHNSVIFLGDLVNDLTTLARAERGGLSTEVESVNPNLLVKDLVRGYQKEVSQKGLQLLTKLSDQVKPLYTSELYAREVLQNFLTNAIKYTPHGSVTLGTSPAPDGGVVFSVADTGIGISAADKEKIFSKFYRSEDYRTRATRGTGLGLYITLKLAERIHAKIRFDSELNKGSTFYIQVPPLPPPPPKPDEAAKNPT